jgi:serine/threonine protein kinase
MRLPERRELVTHGQRFGRYRVRGPLGQRGRGRLYVAEQIDAAGPRIVALKRLLPHLAQNPQFRAMFLKGTLIGARLEHPNIVATYEMGEVEGTYFIAMEYLAGEDLAAVLARSRVAGPMSVEIAAAVAQQALTGLAHAHKLEGDHGRSVPVVRRGVNPSNVFLTYDGIVKLLDFGLVKESAPGDTTPGVFRGKSAYRAPEQRDGAPVDKLADIYSVGIVLWECLTGRPLFAGASQVMEAVRTQRVVPPSTLRPEVPVELDRIAMLALRDDRALRFQSAEEMAHALDVFLSRTKRRPNTKEIGRWLEQLFGAERCRLKKAIAQGAQVEAALARLAGNEAATEARTDVEEATPAAKPSVREIAGTVPMSEQPDDVTSRFEVPLELAQQARRLPVERRSVPPPVEDSTTWPSAPGEGRAMLIAAIVGAVAVAAFVAVMLRDGGDAPTASLESGATGTLQLETEPAGAQLFVDGNPVGSTTPATLRGLRAGRSLEIRLEKAGYQPAVQRIEVRSGQGGRHSFKLTPVAGIIRFEGLPEGASIYLEDVIADRPPLTVGLGRHTIRVEVGGEIVFSRTVDVQPGEQVLKLRDTGRGR